MRAERPEPAAPARTRPGRAYRAATALPVLATLLFGLLALVPGASPANAAAADGPTERIVTALRESPVYVDPAYESALPAKKREDLVARIQKSGEPVYVMLVPLIKGDAWDGSPEQFAAAVHDRRGEKKAHYLMLRDSSLHGEDFGTEDTGVNARYAAMATSYEMDFDGSIAAQVDRAVEITVSGTAQKTYDRATDAYEERNPDSGGVLSLSPGSGGGGSWTGAWVTSAVAALLVVVLAAAVATPLLLRRRRAGREAIARPQHAAFDNADRARIDELAEQARGELVDVGERLSGLELGERGGAAATTALQRALNAHAAAGKALDAVGDGHADLADAAGALVLLDMAEDFLAEAGALDKGRKAPRARAHCYANPLHGTATRTTDWRALGSRRTITVPLCAACARSVRERTAPKALPVAYGGRDVPYFDVPAEESVWSATGFGALRDDLVDRIMRGDLRRNSRSA